MIDQENSTFEHSIRKDDLYKIYEKFCQINKVLSEEKETFGKQLKKIIGKDRLDETQREPTKDPITGKRIYVYKGIKVKPEWLDESRREKQASLLTRTEDEESEELPSDTTTGNNSSEKKASGLSGQNHDFSLPNEQNDAKISLESRSEIASDAEKNAIRDGVKP